MQMEESNNNDNSARDTPEKTDMGRNIAVNGDFNTWYYGVYVPTEIQPYECLQSNVFTDKLEALELVKKHKRARFKAFEYYHEAIEFVVQGAEVPNSAWDSKFAAKKKSEAPPVVSEKCQFRSLKSQDFVKLRKRIEGGDVAFTESAIWDNPRYLISSGDTPSILQEGSRYNALHVAAKAKNANMCELILNTVANIDFIKLLYGDDDHQDAEERAKILLDLYLNTPDKGLNETPLHFAVKYGAVGCVEVLVSFPQCDKKIRNKYGKLPNQLICDRCDGFGTEKLSNQIALLLEDNYYVPVLRSEDNCSPPAIGEPFSPTSPPNLNKNPIHPRVEIHAYAGPMDKNIAVKFRKIWKTPPRLMNCGFSANNYRPGASIESIATLKLKDHEKGLESLGRDLASKYDVGWKEYWPFLGCFVDLASTDGLRQLETYLESKNGNSQTVLNLGVKQTRSRSPIVVSKESSEGPIAELCNAFRTFTLTDDGLGRNATSEIPVKFPKNEVVDLKPDICPYLCIEKSCQVFANRISTDVLNLMYVDDTSTDVLESQMKILEQLILSYIDDGRFSNICFLTAHPRLATLILLKLRENGNNDSNIREIVEKLQENCVKNFDCFSSDDEGGNYRDDATHEKSTSSNKQLECVLGNILNSLNRDLTNFELCDSEDSCRQIWESSDKCMCVWQPKNSRKYVSSKKSSFKVKWAQRNCFDNVSRRLSFDNEELDTADHEKPTKTEFNDCDSSDGEFFTPPSSPQLSQDDEFYDPQPPQNEIFIQGDIPTKTDREVYNALKYASYKLNPTDYPNVYKWHHAVGLYQENQQRSWVSPKFEKFSNSPKLTSTPNRCVAFGRDDSWLSPPHGSPKSWFRITGANSPRASLQTYRTNISFNL